MSIGGGQPETLGFLDVAEGQGPQVNLLLTQAGHSCSKGSPLIHFMKPTCCSGPREHRSATSWITLLLVIQLQWWNIMWPRAGLFLAHSCLNYEVSFLEGGKIYWVPTMVSLTLRGRFYLTLASTVPSRFHHFGLSDIKGEAHLG